MESAKVYSALLNYKELLLLDGKCSEKVQATVEQAKKEASFGLDSFCNEILRKAVECGELTWGYKKIRCCTQCADKPSGYLPYPRNSRYHRKGAPNYDAPFSYTGVAPFQGFIVFQGTEGVCRDCWDKVYLPQIIKYIIENDLPVQIQKNEIAETRWKKDPIRICFECKKEMYESEMGTNLNFMGDGRYKSTCPHCGAVALAFGGRHETTNKFRMLRVEAALGGDVNVRA